MPTGMHCGTMPLAGNDTMTPSRKVTLFHVPPIPAGLLFKHFHTHHL